jgi:hypothetical protein
VSRYGATIRVDRTDEGVHVWVSGRLGVLHDCPVPADPDHPMTRAEIGWISKMFDIPAARVRQAIVECAHASQARGEAKKEAHVH